MDFLRQSAEKKLESMVEIEWSHDTTALVPIALWYLRSPKAAVMMSEGTRLTLASQLDSTGRPVWNPDPRQPFDSILGLPIVVNNALSKPVAGAFAANSLPILVGDFGNFATVRTDGDIRVRISREARAEVLEALVTFSARVGSTICDKKAVAALKIAAS